MNALPHDSEFPFDERAYEIVAVREVSIAEPLVDVGARCDGLHRHR